MQHVFGWRGAYVGASIIGLIVLAVLIAQGEPDAEQPHVANAPAKSRSDAAGSLRVLLTAPILLNLAYFVLTSIMGGGLNTYLVVALGALHATPVGIANMALTSLLAFNALGVLAGGFVAGRTTRHALVAASGLAVGGVVTALVGLFNLPSVGLIALMGFSGFCDMLVRAATPAGAYGLVFGFVSVGFNIGASIAPIVYGYLMDNGAPRAVFLLSAAVSILCISTVTFGFSRRQPA
jgi:predicted MFS family arabinose efflux permease